MRNRIIQQCLSVAQKNNAAGRHKDNTRFLHYTFIVQRNRVLGYGMNHPGEPAIHLGYPKTSKIHSEIDAFRRCKHALILGVKFEALNIRLSKNGELRISKPCPCCSTFLREIGCHVVVYSTDVGFVTLSAV